MDGGWDVDSMKRYESERTTRSGERTFPTIRADMMADRHRRTIRLSAGMSRGDPAYVPVNDHSLP